MPAPLLALRGVRLADGPRQMFDGVDLALEPRARAALVGRNGAGKSTILRMLAGLIQPDDGDRFVTPGLRVGFVLQEPPIEGETLADYASAGGAARHEAEAALMAFDLDPAKGTRGLSGGETRRAALARSFAEQPDVLLLDEPTNHLDILAIATLEAKIAQARSAVLIVSHDRAFLERVTGQCFWLEDRRVRRLDAGFGEFDEWSAKIIAQEAEEARRLDKTLERETHWMLRGVTARRARNEGRRRRLVELRKEKAERLRLNRGELSMSVKVAEPSGRRVVEAEGLSKAFGARTLLKGFSTRIMAGERVAVVGPNGAGKTTLVKILLGEEPPDSGSVKLGANLQISYVDQARADLKSGMTLVEALAPEGGDQIMAQGRPKHVAAYAREFLFRDDQMRQPVSSLSGGERNRLLLARALAMPSNVLVLDEPTNDLDMETLDLLEDILADYDGTLILVSHDRDFIDRLATSTIALDGHGRVVETPGGWGDFLSQNPGFFAAITAAAPAAPKKAPAPPRAAAEPAKLSFKDQHRLKALDELMPKLAAGIAKAEAEMADPGLYGRDPKAFEHLSQTLSKARADLAAAEDEWLALEEKREALQKARG